VTPLAIYSAAGLLLIVAVLLLLRHPGAARRTSRNARSDAADFFPVHYRYFAQARQAFSSENAAFVAGRASAGVRKEWERGCRKAARLYLGCLREDFERLSRLAREIALHAPQVKAAQEAEMFWLDVRFEILYAIVLLRITMGRSAADDVGHIASLIGGLGSRLEQHAVQAEASAGASSR